MRELLFGGILGASVPVSKAVIQAPYFGWSIESESVLKYAVAGGGLVFGACRLIWIAARMIQKLSDGVDELKHGQGVMQSNQEQFHKDLSKVTSAVRELQGKSSKPKTEYVVNNDYDPEHIPTPTKPLPI